MVLTELDDFCQNNFICHQNFLLSDDYMVRRSTKLFLNAVITRLMVLHTSYKHYVALKHPFCNHNFFDIFI